MPSSQACELPCSAAEEDAADQFSAYMMLKFDKEEARRLILGSAYQYKGDMASPTLTIEQQKFADEHGTPAQRFFNLLCTAYGSDPNLFADVVEKGFLPEDRAVGCQREYGQLSHAFSNSDRTPCRWEARPQAAQALAASGHGQAEAMGSADRLIEAQRSTSCKPHCRERPTGLGFSIGEAEGRVRARGKENRPTCPTATSGPVEQACDGGNFGHLWLLMATTQG